MAKVTSFLSISGKLGPAQFAIANGQNIIKTPTSLRGKRWWAHKNLARAQQRAIEFGGASQAAKAIMHQLPGHIRACARQYSHNALINAIRQSCHIHRRYDKQYPGQKTFALTTLSTQGISAAIHNLQLGRDQASAPKVTRRNGHIHITGLPSEAHATSIRSTQTYLRVHIAQVLIGQMQRHPHAARKRSEFLFDDGSTNLSNLPHNSTGWIPLAAIENGTLQIPQPPYPLDLQQGQQTAIVIAIEWRQHTGLRIKNLHERSSLTFIHQPNPVQTPYNGGELAGSKGVSRYLSLHIRHQRTERIRAIRQAIRLRKTDPKEQLRQALQHLRPPA